MHTNRIISPSLAHYLTITVLIFATPALAQDSITNHTYPFHKAPLPNKTLFPAPPGGSDDIGIGLGVFTQYNFVNETKWVPFIGGSAEWARLNSNVISDVSTVSFGVEVGVKYFIKETFALSMAFSSIASKKKLESAQSSIFKPKIEHFPHFVAW